MKKKTIPLLMLLSVTFSCFAEPTFLHRFGEDYGYFNVRNIYDYDTYTSNYYSESSNTELFPSNCLYYFWKENYRNQQQGTYVMNFFDENFNEISSFTYNIPYLKGYKIYSFSISNMTKHLFNDDDDWEYIVQYEWTDSLKNALKNNNDQSYKNNEYRLVVYRSDGSIYYDFGTSGSSIYYSNSLHKVGNTYRMYIDRFIYDTQGNYSRYYDIYQVDKSSSTGLNIIEKESYPYPNPASSEIHLPIESNNGFIKIIDMSGRIIQTCPVSTEDTYILNVSNYPSGVYFYEGGGKTKSFIVK